MDEDGINRTLNFLSVVGIQGRVIIDGRGERLVIIPTAQFEAQRVWLERWFILVHQDGDSCYVRKRLRGTGETI
jgi:hypothetical protein